MLNETLLANCSNVNHFVVFPSLGAQRASFPPLGVERCCLQGTRPPVCLERYPCTSRDGFVPQSHTQRLWGSLHGWYRANSCGMEISWCIQLGTRGAPTRDADYWLCQCLFFFLILCPILNQYVLIKEAGLNIEKYRRKKSQGIQNNTKSLVTFCFCPHLPIWNFPLEMAFNSFIPNQKFILIHSTCKIPTFQRIMHERSITPHPGRQPWLPGLAFHSKVNQVTQKYMHAYPFIFTHILAWYIPLSIACSSI